MKKEKTTQFGDKMKCIKKTSKTFAIGASIGVIAGTILGLLKAPKKGTEIESDIKKRMRELQSTYKKLKINYEPRLKEIFGHAGNPMKIYHEIKDDILEEASKITGRIDRKKFNKLVDDVIGKHKETKKNLGDKLDKLGNEFKTSWDEIKTIFK